MLLTARRLIFISALTSLPAAVSAQAPERVVLRGPETVSAPYFTDVSSAISLPSGAVLVADPGGRELALVAPVTDAIRVLGREGDGPGEYRVPQVVYGYMRDSVLLYDSRQLRMSVLDLNGKYVRSISLGLLGAAALPMATDGQGRVFFRGMNLHASNDRAPVLGFSIHDGRIDTTAYVAMSRLVNLSPGNERAIGGQILRVVPYTDADAFSALSDGGYVVARSGTGQVEWHDRRGNRESVVPFPAGRPPMTDSIRRSVRPVQLQEMLPASLPPFEEYGVVRSTRDRVWIRASARVRGETTWYGFSRAAPKVSMLTLPKGARLVGVSEPLAIVARRMDNDLQRIAEPAGVAANGMAIFVSDAGSSSVLQFTRDGVFVRRIGRRGRGPGEFSAHGAIVVQGDSVVIVSDVGTGRISVFDARTGDLRQIMRFRGAPFTISVRGDTLLGGTFDAMQTSSMYRMVLGDSTGQALGPISPDYTTGPRAKFAYPFSAAALRHGGAVVAMVGSRTMYLTDPHGTPMDSIRLEARARRGISDDLERALASARQPEQQMMLVSILTALTSRDQQTAMVHVDFSPEGTSVSGKAYLSLVDWPTRRQCVDADIALAPDTRPVFAFRGDTLLAVQNVVTGTDSMVSITRLRMFRVPRC